MKRCPHCEFIYEDDQSVCDMDGSKLAYDSRPLPKLQSLATSDSSSDSRWRSRAVPVFASALLAIVLGFVYYVSTRQVATTANAGTESATIEANTPAAPSPEPTVSEATSLTTDAATQPEANNATPDITTAGADSRKPAETRTNANVSRNTKPSQQARSQKGNAKEPAEKDDSKVRSILKKTGRFFKKTLPL